MNYLIDTHILIWSFIEPEKLSKQIRELLLDENNFIYYSQISLWEMSIKYRLGKLVLKGMNPEEFFEEVENSYLTPKFLENHELISFYHLPLIHKDPFDRMLVWQCIRNDLIFISLDDALSKYKEYGLRFYK